MKRLCLLLGLTFASAAQAAQAADGGGDVGYMALLWFVFVISVFLGVELIAKVPSQLHTPLMSGSNAISGITIVGALIAAGMEADDTTTVVLGTIAVVMAMINVIGGYLVTDRMLAMFKKKSSKEPNKS